MITERPADRRDPRHHKWRLWDESRRLLEERRANRADRTIRIIGGVILFAIVIVVFVGGPGFSHQNLLVNVLIKSSWRELGGEGAVAETLQEILTRFEGKIANSVGKDRAGGSKREVS